MKTLIGGISGATVSLLAPLAVFAQDTINLQARGEFTKLNSDSFSVANIITTAITLILIVAAVVFFFMLVIGGLQWIIAGGDKAGAENARKRITNALIGLVIVFVAWAIVRLVGTIFGINILQFSIPVITG